MSVEELELTPKQAAKLMDYHWETVRQLIRDKKLAATKAGQRNYTIPYREILRFQRDHQKFSR
jgi:excisionase family DNA binding protein